ncbi:MAG TPA: RtcB family protein [Flavobacterium sp.]|nr:RtcB family protein [Flavobacterium sp.]
MATSIKAADLMDAGYEANESLGMAIKLANERFNNISHEETVALFKKAKEYPELFLDDDILGELAVMLRDEAKVTVDKPIELGETVRDYKIYGAEHIEEGARAQMDIAMRLPVTVAGALMPDAHQGYGLPIGGVLATKNAVIPYGVGVDIGCRMALSIYDIPEMHFEKNREKYQRKIISNTKFGAGQAFQGKDRANHRVLENPSFNLTRFIKGLKDKAWSQLGTSGGGNHFVEFGIIEFEHRDDVLGIEKGRYVALLTHSGSRGLGATIAGHYTKLAKDKTKLPREASNLAYLDLNSQEGQEYWLAMNLAGDYASACHQVIHDKISSAIGGNIIAKVENHHNFAWKEIWNGEEVIVHRKGATPAGIGVMGIIPGSMTAPGFLVRGKGVQAAINSASHGAGRQMSRSQAIKTISRDDMQRELREHKVDLIGAGRDEAPMAYKDINLVMASQKDLVDVVAKFTPRIVRMADDGSRED